MIKMNQQQFNIIIERLINKFDDNIVIFLERHPELLMSYLNTQFKEMGLKELKEDRLRTTLERMKKIIIEIKERKE